MSLGRGQAELPTLSTSYSFTLSLRDEAAHTQVMLRACFMDRTLAWVSPWGRKTLISAPFLFHPQRFFEVGQSHMITSFGKEPRDEPHNDLGWVGRVNAQNWKPAEKTF